MENDNFYTRQDLRENDNFKEYIKEQYTNEVTEDDERREILRNIINTRKELHNANRNFDFANTDELIDYYIYKIKSMQSKLDGLIKLAKKKGIEVNKIA